MNWVNRVHSFDFDYDSAFNDQVDSVSDFEFLALIDNGQRDFCRYLETPASDLVSAAGLLSTLEKAGA